MGKIQLNSVSGSISLLPQDGSGNVDITIPRTGFVPKVSGVTDNAIVRFDGTTGEVQNSGVVIDDSGNVGIGTSNPIYSLDIRNTQTTNTISDNAVLQLKSSNRNAGIVFDTIGGSYSGGFINYVNGVIKSQILMNATGDILSILPNGGLGYGTGAGATVTQLTSKSTSVTLNKPCGQITLNNSALAAGASVSFVINNSLVSPSDTVIVSLSQSISNFQNYNIWVYVNYGYFLINIKNVSDNSLSDAFTINFAIIKGATA